MSKHTLRSIINATDAPTRKRLILKEVRLLGLILGIWAAVLLADVLLHAGTGVSIIDSLFVAQGRRSRSWGPVYAMVILAGPPIFVAFRLVLSLPILASRTIKHQLDNRLIEPNEYANLRTLVNHRLTLFALVALVIVFALIITAALT